MVLTYSPIWWNQAKGFQSYDEDDETDDDYSDDDDAQSPIDEVDPFIFFVETVQGINIHFFHLVYSFQLTQLHHVRDITNTTTMLSRTSFWPR